MTQTPVEEMFQAAQKNPILTQQLLVLSPETRQQYVAQQLQRLVRKGDRELAIQLGRVMSYVEIVTQAKMRG